MKSVKVSCEKLFGFTFGWGWLTWERFRFGLLADLFSTAHTPIRACFRLDDSAM
jgi:hypothetical protein